MKNKLIVRFKDWNCRIDFRKYSNGRTAIVLVDPSDGEQVAVATVNIPELPLNKDFVIIKDYTENEGMLDALISAGVVGQPLMMVETGYVKCPVCHLLINP